MRLEESFELAESERKFTAPAILSNSTGSYLSVSYRMDMQNATRGLLTDDDTGLGLSQKSVDDTDFSVSKFLRRLGALELFAVFLVAMACTVSVCVGVGGGGLSLPILILMLGFTTHEATGLAQALMVGGTLAGLILNWQQKHPSENRPLIDVTMVLVLGPMQIAGANIGVIINRILPSWLIVVLAVMVLGFAGYKSLMRGIETYQKDCNENMKRKISPKKLCSEFVDTMINQTSSADTIVTTNRKLSVQATFERKERQERGFRFSSCPSDKTPVTADTSPNDTTCGLNAAGQDSPGYSSLDTLDNKGFDQLIFFQPLQASLLPWRDGTSSIAAAHKKDSPSSLPFAEKGVSITTTDVNNVALQAKLPSSLSYASLASQRQKQNSECQEGNQHHHHRILERLPRRNGEAIIMSKLSQPTNTIVARTVRDQMPSLKLLKQRLLKQHEQQQAAASTVAASVAEGFSSICRSQSIDSLGSSPHNNTTTTSSLPYVRGSNCFVCLDDRIGFVYTEKLFNDIMKQTLNSPLRCSQRRPTTNSSALSSQTASSQQRTRSLSTSIRSPLLNFLTNNNNNNSGVRAFSSSTLNLTKASVECIYSDAVHRYLTASATDSDFEKMSTTMNTKYTDISAATTTTTIDNWDQQIGDGVVIQFFISKLPAKKIRILGAYRLDTFELTSSHSPSFKLEMIEIRPLFDRLPHKMIYNKIDSKLSVMIVMPLNSGGEQQQQQQQESPQFLSGIAFNDESDHSGGGLNPCSSGETYVSTNSFLTADNSSERSLHLKNENTRASELMEKGLLQTMDSYRSDDYITAADAKKIQKILKKEISMQYRKWIILLCIWILNCTLILTKGGKASSGVVVYCKTGYWILSTLSIIFPAVISAIISVCLIRMTHLKLSLDIPFIEGELIYTPGIFNLLAQTFVAGIAAGVIGIGGGMILGPMMLSEGISPQVTAAVNSTLVLFASSSAALNFIVSGQADPSWALLFSTICFLSSLIGKYFLDRMVQKYNLNSLLVFLLSLITLLSLTSMLISGILEVIAFGVNGFSNPCD